MFTEEDEAKLAHFGVKGMKWGVRKAERRAQREAKRRLLNPKISEMTNAELQQRISRLDLEKRYRDLTKPQLKKGDQIYKEMAVYLAGPAKKAASPYVEQAMKELLKKTFGAPPKKG